MVRDCYPDESTKVHFSSATGWVKNAHIRDKPASDVTSSHRGMVVPMESGYILIDQAWGRRPQEKMEKLNDNTIKELKKRFKKK